MLLSIKNRVSSIENRVSSMLCEICRENQVSFIISVSEDSSVREIRVCEECATCDVEHRIPDKHGDSELVDKECPECHSRYQKIKRDMNGRDDLPLLGCPVCYTEFREELTPLLRRIHGSVAHVGKAHKAKSKRRRTKHKEQTAKGKKNYNLRSMVRGPRAEAEWMQGNGPDCDVVISTRVRLARNLPGYRFCNLAEPSELDQIATIVEDAVSFLNKGGNLPLRNASTIRLEHLDDIDREFLIERHLISRDLAEKNGTAKAIVGEKEIVSIMLNEEDHIRLQVINSGLRIRQSWEIIDAIDDGLGQELDYACSSGWGYLTACPTNVGTGLRVSVMLHIPALAATKEGGKVLSSVSDMGYTIRGMYGEGSQAIGAFYQISNEATLGQTEEEITDRIQSIARQIMDREREERQLLVERNGLKLEDTVFRSYGTLVNSRSMSSREAQTLLSWVSLGVNIGILSEASRSDIAQLLVLTRPAHLQKYEGRRLDAAARDISRAAVIRAILAGNG
ncbi:protein arginine kinase [Candidatus Poribacteria bacterium]